MQVRDGLDVNRDHARAGGDEIFDIAIWFLDHQVDVERPRRDALDRADHGRPDGDVGDEVAVHDVHVNEVGAAAFRGGDVAPECGEVSGENRGSDLYERRSWRTAHRLTSSEMASPDATLKPPEGCWWMTVPGGIPGTDCVPT